MPKGHPISVPRTWPGHRDYEPHDALGYDPAEASIAAEPRYPDLGQHDDITQERLDDPEHAPVVELHGEAAQRATEILRRRGAFDVRCT